jgi:2-polyprenyl-3-methyl-5-hydroxy-6-metoxy-1,4-benzoquinol methylase
MPLTFSERPSILTTEILDTLPADHPDALSSRRDIRLFNRALGNWRWLERQLPGRLKPNEAILEIGAGTGELGQRMAPAGLKWDGLDLAPRPFIWPTASRWHQTDLFSFTGWKEYPVVVANLFLHHFDSQQLRQLGAHLNQHARIIAVGDLRRGRLQRWLFLAMAKAIQANKITRHDGWASVTAGFRGQELPQLLALDPAHWTWRFSAHTCAYRMIAERRR